MKSLAAIAAKRITEREDEMAIVIEKGIPIPLTANKRISELTETLKAMDVGDSFVCSRSARNSLSQRMIILNPKRFVTRSVDKDNMRVWRTL